ncbi:OsmC family protein [Candidatus Nucleicultrix amoebiphila]|nr:OsmC family protein [Candidatus Nucleicultrix amoebiphila]
MMAITRKSDAHWSGDLMNGQGTIHLGSKVFEGPYSFKERTSEHSSLTNPEELIAAGHAGCFSMALSALLTQAGFPPESIKTTAAVTLDKDATGFALTEINLSTKVHAPGLSQADFERCTQSAKTGCPISRALSTVKITLAAELV